MEKLFVMLAIFLPGLTFAQEAVESAEQPAAVETSETPGYRPGLVSDVYPSPDATKLAYRPRDSFGSFVNNSNPYTLRQHRENTSLQFITAPSAYDSHAYIQVTEAGLHTFLATIKIPPVELFTDPINGKGMMGGEVACHYVLTVQDKELLRLDINSRARTVIEQQRRCGWTDQQVGSINLQPGLYSVRQWAACAGKRNLRSADTVFYLPPICGNNETIDRDLDPADEVLFGLRLKRPGSTTPSALGENDFLYKVSN